MLLNPSKLCRCWNSLAISSRFHTTSCLAFPFSCQILCCCPGGCGDLIIQVNITRGLWCSPFRIHPHRDSPINMPAFKAAETPQTIFWAFQQEAIILLRKCSLLSRGSRVSMQHSAHAGALLLQEGSSGPQDVPYLSVSPCGTHTLLRMLHKHTQWLTQHKILVIHCKNKLLCRWLLPVEVRCSCAATCAASRILS